jgi:hypothetical protein
MAWNSQIPTDQAYRRAGGRRQYNAHRSFEAQFRQYRVELMLLELNYYLGARGVQRRIAQQLGVSEATISRDVATIHARRAMRNAGPLSGKWRLYAHPDLRPQDAPERLPPVWRLLRE